MECFFACAYGPQSTFVAPIMHTIIFLREIVCALFQLRLRQYWQLCTLSLAVLRNNAVNFFYCGYLDSALEHSWVDACSLYKKKKSFITAHTSPCSIFETSIDVLAKNIAKSLCYLIWFDLQCIDWQCSFIILNIWYLRIIEKQTLALPHDFKLTGFAARHAFLELASLHNTEAVQESSTFVSLERNNCVLTLVYVC